MHDKSVMRAQLKAARAVAFAKEPDAGAALIGHFPSVIEITQRTIVAAFMPFRTEIDPFPLVRHLREQGARVVMPRIAPLPIPMGRGVGVRGLDAGAHVEMTRVPHQPLTPDPSPHKNGARGDALSFHLCDIDEESHFQVNPMGLREPREDLPTAHPEIVLVPLLGFDRQGNRLGYGKGYYDRALARLREHHPITAVGLAFSAQEVRHIPTQPHDQRLDWIVTEIGAIDCRL